MLYSKVTQLYIIIFWNFPLWFIIGYWVWFPVLYSRTLLFIHPMFAFASPVSWVLEVQLISNSCPSLLCPSLHCSTSLFSIPMSLFLFHRYVHLCHILDSTHKWYPMIFVFLTSLCMIISRSIHIAANGII